MTGKDLVYTEIIGKPSLLTMRHADNMAQLHAQTLGYDGVRTIYFVGYLLTLDAETALFLQLEMTLEFLCAAATI